MVFISYLLVLSLLGKDAGSGNFLYILCVIPIEVEKWLFFIVLLLFRIKEKFCGAKKNIKILEKLLQSVAFKKKYFQVYDSGFPKCFLSSFEMPDVSF
jgi:hypothetical protein